MTSKMINNNDMAIRSALEDAERIAIFSHIHPDGDAIGAQLGLAQVLRQLGKTVDIYNQTGRPESFAFLPGMNDLSPWTDQSPEPDVKIALDCGNLDRLGLSQAAWAGKRTITIDHHAGHEPFSDLNYVDSESPATCAIMADLCRKWGFPLSAEAATCLLTGIHTDTGSFRYEKTSADTFSTAAWLMTCGADLAAIRYHVFESTSKARFQLLNALYNSSEFIFDGKVAVAEISHDLMASLGVADDEVHGLVGQLKEVQGVELSILLRELATGEIKVSLRSKQYVDCNQLAGEFGGGGHVRAAGCKLKLPMAEARQVLTERARSYLKREAL
ncbi:DHH family phosphoesterase [Peptococcus simiae]|uniref:DHH family phosphoesterase n=1 Tax=Peptococcus simiae TaxID=1643805 RepID=UPI00397FF9CE